MSLTFDDYKRQLRELSKTRNLRDLTLLTPTERFWGEHQEWLASQGYMLRPRYRSNWKPSWIGTKKSPRQYEDGWINQLPGLMDATRILDDFGVILKMVWKSQHPYETEICQYFSSTEIASQPGNHCVPIIDILTVPEYSDLKLIVMPVLRAWDSPPMHTVGEAVDFFGQIFEGLEFIHKHKVAHRDCAGQNIMMDARSLFPDGFHPNRPEHNHDGQGTPRHYTRTEKPPVYYFTDFGLSRRYDISDLNPSELPIRGGDKSVPEFQGEGYNKASNPFCTDIYYLGNLIRMNFIQLYTNFDFMVPLVTTMVEENPSKRPTIEEARRQLQTAFSGLNDFTLRTRLVRRNEISLLRLFRDPFHYIRQVSFIARKLPAIPVPSVSPIPRWDQQKNDNL